MQPTKEQIKEKFESLPKDIQDAMSAVDSSAKIVAIGRKYKIQLDEIGELVNETGLVMLGFSHPNDFVKNIQTRLDIPYRLAETIAQEINIEIFIKVKESLKKIHEQHLETSHELDREKILNEIENRHQTTESHTDLILPTHQEIIPVQKNEAPAIPTNNIINDKLSSVVSIPATEKDFSQTINTDQSIKKDPYREPLE